MLQFLLLVAATVSSLNVLPAPSRPRTQKLSRGPVWTDFQKLVVDPKAIREAQQAAAGLQRIAVVTTPTATPGAAEIAAEIIRSQLRYGEGLIVVDGGTAETLFADVSKPLVDTARDAQIDLVLSVRSQEPSGLAFELFKVGDPKIARWQAPDANTPQAAAEAGKDLLQRLDAMPTRNAEYLGRVPQATAKGFAHYLAARRLLFEVARTANPKQRKLRCAKALRMVERALDDSPDCLEAYLLKASCHDELEQDVERNQTLTTAKQKSNPPQHDQLTLLELRGDYARFVERDVDGIEKSFSHYEEMLRIDPSNLTGLWTMIDILITSLEGVPEKVTLQMAAKHAAKLVACHPDSQVALEIMNPAAAP